MRFSEIFAPTLREVPAEAEVISHKLMLRAGMMRKAASGVYTYMPLAWRVLKKIMNIVREEMDVKGGQELMLPIMQPAELWRETGRWDVYGDEMFRLKDRHGREFCLGPTHEEIITALVRGEVRSYRQLPLMLYQIQNKYRDEIRPRFGLMRGREFIMKDLYSFDRDEEGLDRSYQKMYDAYTRIFTRCGLQFRPVEADSGAIGGSSTHEFMVIAESGEAAIVYCADCNYAANVEKAECLAVDSPSIDMMNMEEVATPNQRTIEEVAAFLHVSADQCLKTLLYIADEKVIAVIVRGDHEVNEIKLKNYLDCIHLQLASLEVVEKLTGAGVGYAGPVDLQNVPVLVDFAAAVIKNAVCGANKNHMHLKNVNLGRDYQAKSVLDLRMIQLGDPCPRCSGEIKFARGIEVGQVFKLGTKYSKALGCSFLDEKGQEKTVVMGCYGVGVSRTMASAIEQNYDEHGIVWPVPIAPYHVVVVPVSTKDTAQMDLAEKIYRELQEAGLETVLDDRDERPGVKFKDADLIGYPLRVTIGAKTIAEGLLEVKARRTGEEYRFSLDNYVQNIKEALTKL
jgi:prolyl-tRNA synthetase